jgi:hypothetical protein
MRDYCGAPQAARSRHAAPGRLTATGDVGVPGARAPGIKAKAGYGEIGRRPMSKVAPLAARHQPSRIGISR